MPQNQSHMLDINHWRQLALVLWQGSQKIRGLFASALALAIEMISPDQQARRPRRIPVLPKAVIDEITALRRLQTGKGHAVPRPC